MKRTGLTFALITSLAVLAGCSSSSSSTTQKSADMNMDQSAMPAPSLAPGMATAAPGGGSFLSEKLPAEVLALPLFDSAGNTFTLGDYSGKYVVITNFLTSCHEICPMTTINMRDIARAVSAVGLASKVAVLELSVDGERDTAPRLAAYQALFNDRSWTMAGGSSASLSALWKYFGAPAKKEVFSAADVTTLPQDWQTGKSDTYDMMHSDVVIILGPDSTWRWLDLGSPKTTKGDIPQALKTYLTQDGQQNLAAPEEPTWSVEAVLAALTQLTMAG
ncbi:MAG: SCO family protein [Actinomycetes bacterium]